LTLSKTPDIDKASYFGLCCLSVCKNDIRQMAAWQSLTLAGILEMLRWLS